MPNHLKSIPLILLFSFISLAAFGQRSIHLKDTDFINGNFVLFLRPDSVRFVNDAKTDEHIYTADGDFGSAISATIDSLSKIPRYMGIKANVTDKRYIQIQDCRDCPMTIDRDTIDYGLIFVRQGEKIKLISNSTHGSNYLSEIDKYFGIRATK